MMKHFKLIVLFSIASLAAQGFPIIGSSGGMPPFRPPLVFDLLGPDGGSKSEEDDDLEVGDRGEVTDGIDSGSDSEISAVPPACRGHVCLALPNPAMPGGLSIVPTTFGILVKNSRCYFSPFAERSFKHPRKVRHPAFGIKVPCIYLPTITWKEFEPIMTWLRLGIVPPVTPISDPKSPVVAAAKFLRYNWWSPAPSTYTLTNEVTGAIIAAFDFVKIPAINSLMGSLIGEKGRTDDENRLMIAMQPFEMQTTPVTQAQWRAVIEEYDRRFPAHGRRVLEPNPSYFKTGEDADSRPVENVSYAEIQEWIFRLNALGLGTFDLPKDDQWESAAQEPLNSSGVSITLGAEPILWEDSSQTSGGPFLMSAMCMRFDPK